MKYYEKVALNSDEVIQAEKLTKIVQLEDHTYKGIYLSNQFNYFTEMPTFIYAIDNGKMIGLTMLYADEKPDGEVELHVEVAPDYRGRGIAREMTKRAQKIMAQYGYNKYCFVSEKSFINKNVDFLAKTKLDIDDHDFYMVASKPERIAKNDNLDLNLAVREMNKNDIEKVVQHYSKAFDENIESTKNYILESFKDKEKVNFVLTYQDEIAGYCAVDLGIRDYFFGLFIRDDFRGRGYATFFIKKMMAELKERGSKEFELEVEPDNLAAVHAYQNAGFEIKSEVVYLKRKR